jgi:HSP90 family molecular chaperone
MSEKKKEQEQEHNECRCGTALFWNHTANMSDEDRDKFYQDLMEAVDKIPSIESSRGNTKIRIRSNSFSTLENED